jgi:hypothetical protein
VRFQDKPENYLPATEEWQNYINTRFQTFVEAPDIPDVWNIQDPFDLGVTSIMLSVLATDGAFIPTVEQARKLIQTTDYWREGGLPPALQVEMQGFSTLIEVVQTSDAFGQWAAKNFFQVRRLGSS